MKKQSEFIREIISLHNKNPDIDIIFIANTDSPEHYLSVEKIVSVDFDVVCEINGRYEQGEGDIKEAICCATENCDKKCESTDECDIDIYKHGAFKSIIVRLDYK